MELLEQLSRLFIIFPCLNYYLWWVMIFFIVNCCLFVCFWISYTMKIMLLLYWRQITQLCQWFCWYLLLTIIANHHHNDVCLLAFVTFAINVCCWCWMTFDSKTCSWCMLSTFVVDVYCWRVVLTFVIGICWRWWHLLTFVCWRVLTHNLLLTFVVKICCLFLASMIMFFDVCCWQLMLTFLTVYLLLTFDDVCWSSSGSSSLVDLFDYELFVTVRFKS